MKLPNFSVILLAFAVSALGLLLVPRLEFNFVPQNQKNSIQVYFSFPNANPRQVEEVITTPIEASISLVQGIHSVKSISRYGGGFISAEIDEGSNMDFIRYEISGILRQIYPHLPREVPFPFVRLNDSEKQMLDPVLMTYTLSGPFDASQVFQIARDRIAPELGSAHSLERVDVLGANEEEWVINYDPDQLQLLGISPILVQQSILDIISSESFSYQLYDDSYLYVRSEPGQIVELKEQSIQLKDEIIPLTDLIQISRKEALPNHFYRINGKNSVRLNLIPRSNANHLDLARRIRKEIIAVNKSLPEGYELHLEYDSTRYIDRELDKIQARSAWSLGILFFLVVLAYRRWLDLGIIFSSLLINLAVAVILYDWFDVQLNLYALAAITISFGIIIDNTIIMSHHFQKHNNIHVFRPLLTATLTTLSALLVLLALPDELKFELMDFSKVLSVNLTLSLVICLLVVPAMIRHWRGKRSNLRTRNFNSESFLFRINKMYNHMVFQMRKLRKLAIVAIILLFGLPVFMLPNKVEGWNWYNQSLGSDYYVENVKPWVNRILGGTSRLFSLYVYEGSGYRSPEETKLYVNCSLPEGSTIEQMNDVMSKMETYIDSYIDRISTYVTNVSSGQRSSIVISFEEGISSSFPFILKSRLQSFAIDMGGATWNIYGVGKAFSNASGSNPPRFKVMFRGYNKEEINRQTGLFTKLLLEHPRIREVDQDANLNWWEKNKYKYVLSMDRSQAAYANVDLSDLKEQIMPFSQERSFIGIGQDNIPIKIAAARPGKMDLWQLEETYRYQDSIPINFKEFVSLDKSIMANSIHKENQEYLQMLEFEYTGSARFGQRYLDECLAQFAPTLPLGYSVTQSSFSFWGGQEQRKYGLLLLVIVSIFFICSIHFESLKAAGWIILLIPLSYIGIFITFYCFDFPFDQGGYVSFLLVSGLVVNALIIILSDYYRFKKQWPRRRPIDLYLRAFRYKSTPVFLTIISTAVGLLPFTMHGSQEVFWFSLAVGTIGGLVFSIFVILFIVPLFIGTTTNLPE